VIVVVASRLDPEAQSVVASWHSAGAALLSAEDLGRPGWEFRPQDPAGGTAVVDGQRVRVKDLRAVLTRRPAVLAEELGRIDPGDRIYVAAETNAFLVAWLSALPCAVVNRPTPRSLCGPAWDALHWRAAAARVGAAWSETEDATEAHEVVVCGKGCLFARRAREAAIARALAREAGAELLGVRFQGERVSSVTVAPCLADGEVRARLLAHLQGDS
jgi:uncharacterized protein (DUF433 family)